MAQQCFILLVELLSFCLPGDPQHAEHGGTVPGEDRHPQVSLARFGADLGVFLAPNQVFGDAPQFLVVLDVGDAQRSTVTGDPAGQSLPRFVLHPLGGHLCALQEAGGAAQDVAAGDVVAQEDGRAASVEPVTGIAHDQRHQTIAIQLAIDFQQFLVESEHLAPDLLKQVQTILDEQWQQGNGHNVLQFDQDVQRRPSRVLQGVAKGVADHSRCVGLGTLAAKVPLFD